MKLLSRLFDLAIAAVGIAVVISAGWLQSPHYRAGAIVALVVCLGIGALALR